MTPGTLCDTFFCVFMFCAAISHTKALVFLPALLLWSCLLPRRVSVNALLCPSIPATLRLRGLRRWSPLELQPLQRQLKPLLRHRQFMTQFLPRDGGFQSGTLLGDEAAQFVTRHRHLGVTYARCDAPLEVVMEHIGTLAGVTGQRGVVEHHQDGFPHIHVLVQRKVHPSPLSAERFVVDYQGRQFRCRIRNLQTLKHQHNWHVYLQKEGVPQEWGRYRPVCQYTHDDYILIAQEQGVGRACELWLAGGGHFRAPPQFSQRIGEHAPRSFSAMGRRST